MRRTLDFQFVYQKLGYEFKDKSIVTDAFTHSSYAHQYGVDSNERLEFLGDAILDFLVADYLYKSGDIVEGEMSKMRAFLVGSDSLCQIISTLGLDKMLLTGDSFIGSATKSMREDLFEAIVGAIYLDGGLERAKEFIFSNIDMSVTNKIDYKTRLQEIVQKSINCEPIYKTKEHLDKEGYSTELFINGIFITASIAPSKKQSQVNCAKWAFEHKDIVNKALNKDMK